MWVHITLHWVFLINLEYNLLRAQLISINRLTIPEYTWKCESKECLKRNEGKMDISFEVKIEI